MTEIQKQELAEVKKRLAEADRRYSVEITPETTRDLKAAYSEYLVANRKTINFNRSLGSVLHEMVGDVVELVNPRRS